MSHNEIKKFITKENKPYNYCLEFEYGNANYLALNPVARYFAYKSTGVRVERNKENYNNAEQFCLHSIATYGDIPDCDGSDGKNALILNIYKELWNFEKGYYAFGEISTPGFKGEFGGDTMNSLQTTFNFVMKKMLEKPENSIMSQYRKNNYSFMDCLQIYCTFPEKLTSELHKECEFIQFINLYHTIGNMVLVPRRFNSGRYARTFDFWDSSLVWLKKDGFFYGKSLMFDKQNFIKYINYFYLWDYVDCINNKYIIKPLFDSHKNIESGSIGDSILWTSISTQQDLKQFLHNSCQNIKKRGIFMTLLLRLKSSENFEISKISNQFFEFIQGEEFLNTAHINAYEIALKRLKFMFNQLDISNNEEAQKIYKDVLSLM